MLAWTKDMVHTIAWIADVRTDHRSVQEATLMMAAVCVWILNFAIQPLQSGVRALIIDSCPPEYMDTANAWASRMISIGSLLGYSSGFVHLPSFLEFSGNSKFKALCVLATSGLVVTVSLCLLIRERDPNEDGAPEKELRGVVGKFKYIRRSVFKLHPLVVKVMKAQFWSWIGWFSFMYYITTAGRHGSLALLVFAITQLITSIIAPFLIPKTNWDAFASPTSKSLLSRLIRKFTRTPWSTLCNLWMLSHFLFALSMFSTLFITTVSGTIVLTSIIGISAALAQFVPFTLISIVLSNNQNSNNRPDSAGGNKKHPRQYETQPGIVMGLHNMAIAAPQLIAAAGSSLIFWVMGGEAGDARSTVWVLRAGGLMMLMAMYMTTKVKGEVGYEPAYELRASEAAAAAGEEQSQGLLSEVEMAASNDTDVGLEVA
ncbi:MAG: hypothetical protein Q9164_003674 [Protoblastenia rupestris]